MLPEVVIYDQYYSNNLALIAKQEAQNAGLVAEVFKDAMKAADSVGSFTVSVISSTGPVELFHNPLQSAIWLGLPLAVLQAQQNPSIRERNFITDPANDVLVTRAPENSAIESLRKWFESIRNPRV